MKKQRITIRLDEQEQSILSNLSRRENSYELTKHLGLIGVTKELPSDLSSNKDYFKGFGE